MQQAIDLDINLSGETIRLGPPTVRFLITGVSSGPQSLATEARMVLYTDSATAEELTSAVLNHLRGAVNTPPHQHTPDVYKADGYTHFYRADVLCQTGTAISEEADATIGKALARAVQRGFADPGYNESQIRVRYALERTDLNIGTSPKLELQVDTKLEPPDLLTAIAKAEPYVVVNGRRLDTLGFENMVLASGYGR